MMTCRLQAASAFCLLPSAFCLLSGCGGTSATPQPTPKVAAARPEDQLESARQVLAESPDRAACATALRQINAYLTAHEDRRAPALTAEQKDLLTSQFALDRGEMAEVESNTYTLLDGPHLEFCFLVRDVARALEADKLSPAEKAATAFAWVMRQMYPVAGEDLTSPEFSLRRGAGSGPERAHVLLALLHQMGIPGCLVMTANAPAPWACGALVEVEGVKEKQVLLFDHRLGLPLPGAAGPGRGQLARAYRLALPVAGPDDGREIVTLAALRKQPELLKPLTVEAAHPYDVTAEQVKDSVVRLAPPLSALSPRMRALQDDLLPQRLGARLAVDPAELIRQFGSAAGVEGGAESVRGRDRAPGVLRRFLNDKEGGIDKAGGTDTPGGIHIEERQQLAKAALIPRTSWPRQLAELEGDPGIRIRSYAARQFLSFQLDPHLPRDLVLRGQFKEAAAQLTSLLEQIRIQKDTLQTNPEVYADFETWKQNLFAAFGEAGRAQDEARKGGPHEAAEAAVAQRERVWKSGSKVLSILVDGATAGARDAQGTYQLALCLHEEAERQQARADRLAHGNPPASAADLKGARAAAEAAWKDAEGWWSTYTQKHPLTTYNLQARLLRARAWDAMGNPGQARALLEDTPPQMIESQRIARLYLARRLQSP